MKNANRPHHHGVLVSGQFAPFSKNPTIAKFFVQMAFAEDLGAGINNVYRFLKHYAGTEPIFKEQDIFEVIIPITENIKNNGGVAE